MLNIQGQIEKAGTKKCAMKSMMILGGD